MVQAIGDLSSLLVIVVTQMGWINSFWKTLFSVKVSLTASCS